MTTDVVTKERTLAEIVDLDTGSARVLERFGLDYCCGGRRPLGDACDEAGIDADEVVAALTDAAPQGTPEWTTMTVAQLVDHIESTHHAYLHAELPRLQALAEKVEGVHGGRHPELARVTDLTIALRKDLEPHLAKEENILFPMIRQLTTATEAPEFHCGSIAGPIRMMMFEHDGTGEILAHLQEATEIGRAHV